MGLPRPPSVGVLQVSFSPQLKKMFLCNSWPLNKPCLDAGVHFYTGSSTQNTVGALCPRALHVGLQPTAAEKRVFAFAVADSQPRGQTPAPPAVCRICGGEGLAAESDVAHGFPGGPPGTPDLVLFKGQLARVYEPFIICLSLRFCTEVFPVHRFPGHYVHCKKDHPFWQSISLIF